MERNTESLDWPGLADGSDRSEGAGGQSRPRILLFTGKGGVGKTTIAAATAQRAADMGHKVIVLSADPAHSLGDALDRTLGPEPVEIAPGLYGMEVDVFYSIQKYWGTLRQYVVDVFKWRQMDEILAEEMAVLPGMEEAAAFLWVEKLYREAGFDVIVIDSAPTGETLTLLSLPLVGQWWMKRGLPLPKGVLKAVGPVVRALSGTPRPSGEAVEEAEDLYEKLLSIHSSLSDPAVSSVRIVVNPERMVIQEARRAYAHLQLYGYPVDSVITNRILPAEAAGFFRSYVKAQEGYLKEIEETFAPVPILSVPHLGREVFGTALLREIGTALYPERDPAEAFLTERPYRLEAQNGTYLLEIHLPFMETGDVAVLQYGDELVVEVKGQRRNLFLPKFLGFYSAKDARLNDGWLRVRFEKTGETQEREAEPQAQASTPS